MCGIVGVVNLDQKLVDEDLIARMADSLSHRGPDGNGSWIDGSVGLGHRRLSVIDPTPAGAQPMLDIQGDYVLSYNGEVYNYKKLRSMLEKEGCTFRTATDTEVVLQSLISWGAKAIEEFNGMFALAFWDLKERKLLIARDRYGIKPLYYSIDRKRLIFASEQRAIREVPNFSTELDFEALIEYFTFQNIFTDRTFDTRIKLLPAGHYMTLDLRDPNPQLNSVQYWDYSFESPSGEVDKREYVEELDRLFCQAVERNLISDVEVGCYLSGGMDSSSIVSVATKSIPDLKTFTCGFDMESVTGIELAFDERQAAERASAAFKTEHFEIVLKAGDLEKSMHNLVNHIEEPRVGQSYPNYYAALLAGRFVKVVLSGAGGDELFGGYPWRYFSSFNSGSYEDYIDSYYLYWQRLIPNKRLHKLFSPIYSEVRGVSTRDIFSNVFPEDIRSPKNRDDYINSSLYFEAKTFLHGLLVVEDKLSMAHGLETRVPFLDNDLVDFSMKCPVELKVRDTDDSYRIDENIAANKTQIYFEKTNNGKLILRSAMESHLPKEVLVANKRGFSGPDASWFRGESIDYVKRKLLSGEHNLSEIVNQDTVEEMLDEHFSGKVNNRLAIWSLLYAEELIGQVFN